MRRWSAAGSTPRRPRRPPAAEPARAIFFGSGAFAVPVLVSLATAPDVGVTPFALVEAAAHADTDRAALLTRLSASYNAALRGTIANDGRRIGLILLDETISAIAKFPGLDGFTNTTEPVCDLTRSALTPPSALDCTAQTFVVNGSATYFWADDRHLGPSAQNIFGSSAITRARNNPF